MNIILEGPDGTGKSYFAKQLARSLHVPRIVLSQGPERYPGEINERIQQYFDEEKASHQYISIYDRHPCISQSIYAGLDNGGIVSNELMTEFESRNYLIIYFQGNPQTIENQVRGEFDTRVFLEKLKKGYLEILQRYEDWAREHAHIYRRCRDDNKWIINAVKGALHDTD